MTIVFLLLFGFFGFIAYSSLSARIRSIEDTLKKTQPSEIKQPVLELRETRKEFPANIDLEPERNQPKPQEPLSKAKNKPSDLELRLGGKVFTAVGVIAVLFGVGFFLRYAFENNLISPVLRVALGFIASILCLGLGEWLRKKYAKYGQTLMGLGLGIAYLTWYATLHFYHLIGSPIVFIGMILVTAIGLILALRLNSAPLAIFAQIGGFLTPALVGGHENQYLVLFSYILILDIAILALAYFKTWREVTLVGIIGTAASFFAWFTMFHDQTPWIFPFLFVTLYFILFSIASLMRYTMKKSNMDKADLFILAINPALYAIAVYNLMPSEQNLLTGIWFGVIGLIYVALTSIVTSNTERDRRYQNALAVMGTAFLAIAIPIAFHGVTVLIAWAILATALIAWGYLVRSHLLLLSAHIVSLFPVLGILGRILSQNPASPAWLNSTFWSNIGVIICLSIAVWIHWKKEREGNVLKLTESERVIMRSFVLVEAYILTCIVFLHELQRSTINHVWIFAVISLIALLGAWIGAALKSLPLRVISYLTFVIVAFSFLIFSTGMFVIETPFLNARIASGLIIIFSIAAMSALNQKIYADHLSNEERRLMRSFCFTGIHLLGLYLVSTEITGWFNTKIYLLPETFSGNPQRASLISAKNASLSVVWTIYALALLVFGIIKKSFVARRFAIILFSFTVLKAFLYDTASLNNLYRFVSFMTLGVLLLFSGYLYHRFKDRIRKFL